MLFMYNIYYLICAKIQYIEQYFSTKKLRNLHFCIGMRTRCVTWRGYSVTYFVTLGSTVFAY